jgi:molecular chaperone GrpE
MSLSKDKGKKKPPEGFPHPESGAATAAPAPGDVQELKNLLAAKAKEAEEVYERLLRTTADMENLKKRQEKERADLLQFANENLIKELLPVLDSLELALEHGRQQEAPAAFLEGLELVHQGFLKILARFGVTPFVSVGQPFDPAFHNAVMQAETTEAEDGAVLKEMQKGYLLNQRLLRPAMVAVAHNPQKSLGKTD